MKFKYIFFFYIFENAKSTNTFHICRVFKETVCIALQIHLATITLVCVVKMLNVFLSVLIYIDANAMKVTLEME